MIDISVTVDTKSFEKEFAVFPDQIAWSVATAINKTLIAAQKVERAHLKDEFTIRRQGFVNNQIKITPFAKKDSLEGTIKVAGPKSDPTRDLLSKFEDGGTKTANNAGGNIAIPLPAVQPDGSKVVPISKRPKNLAGVFKLKLKSGKEVLATHQLRGMKGTMAFVYALEPSVPIPKKLDFESTVYRVVDTEWETQFNEAWEKAMATATEKALDNFVDSILG